jgi:Tfp pilus assembly protein PilF
MANQANKDKVGNATAEEEKRAIEIETIVETNIATCHLKLLNAKQAIEHADRALTLNASYWKAILRKAEAQILLKNYDSARSLLTSAQALVTEEAWITKIQKEFTRIASLEKKEDAEQRKKFAGIFDRANATDST